MFVRQAQDQSLARQWSIPWGMVEEGEAMEDATQCETREEGGIIPVGDSLLGI